MKNRYKDYPIIKKVYIQFILKKVKPNKLLFKIKRLNKKFKNNSSFKKKVFNKNNLIELKINNYLIKDKQLKVFDSIKERDIIYKKIIKTLIEFVRKYNGFTITDKECYNCSIPWCNICGRYDPKLISLKNDLFIIKRE